MSAKRQATSDLNHENWDRDEEPEDMGTFPTAPKDELKNRVIKKARRKIPEILNNDGSEAFAGRDTKSIFSGFAGFAKTPTSGSSAMGAFSFLSKIPSVDCSASAISSNTSAVKSSFLQNELKTTSETIAKTVDDSAKKPVDIEKSNDYYCKLKSLNECVCSWIKLHVDKNPLCILTPIFKDYEKYLNDINKSEKETAVSAAEASSSNSAKPTTTLNSFKFSATPASAAPATSTSAASFSFGSAITQYSAEAKTDNKLASLKTNGFSWSTPENKTNFSFGIAPSTTTTGDDKPTSTVFNYPKTKPATNTFTFANVAANPPASSAATSSGDTVADDGEDEPPKVEFKQVVEEDAVYSKKVRFFVKSDGKFSDRGVGTLYFKPIKESTKMQLLLRADTNLGNILANFILNESIPAQRTGKNMVMLVCVPTPDFEKATPILLRVKTSEEADALLETIEKYKK